MAGISEDLRKQSNRVEIARRALEADKELAGFFEGPSPKQLPGAPVQADGDAAEKPGGSQTQYFWERFWADAQVTSVPYVQELYAKILGGQLKKPGSFSLRTLDVIRCLDEETANLFNRVRGYVVMGMSLPDLNDDALGEDRLHHSDYLRLAEAGLAQAQESTLKHEVIRKEPILLAGALCRVHSDAEPPFEIHVRALTVAGGELYSLLPPDFSKREYLLRWYKEHVRRILVSVDGGKTYEEWTG
jgi:hypothetical protein